MSFEEFESTVYREPDTGIYIVDGDTPIATRDGLKEFFANHVRSGALIVNTVGNADDRWSDQQKGALTYCVSTAFGGNYNNVVRALGEAAAEWSNVAHVSYRHDGSQDGSCTSGNNNIVFNVAPTSGQPYLARAFFPSDARVNRNILIDSSSFGNITPWTLTGILRHELGHTLGFRHEHTRPEAGTCFEDNNWRALTGYDSASVMHYPHCNGTNQGDLILTQRDRDGAAALYPGRIPRDFPGDYNQDGRADILWHNTSTGVSQVWYMNGSTRTGAQDVDSRDGGTATAGAPWHPVASNDFNQDARPDILWHNVSTGEMQIWHLNGPSIIHRSTVTDASGTRLLIGAPWRIVGSGDFNGDRKPDILWHNDSHGETQIWYMNGSIRTGAVNVTWSDGSTPLIVAPWQIVAANDFNQDGKTDILWHNDSTGITQVWQMNGSVRIGAPNVTSSDGSTPQIVAPWQIVGANDYNQDGKTDILWHNDSTGITQVWQMNGSVRVGAPNVTSSDGSTPQIVAPWNIVNH